MILTQSWKRKELKIKWKGGSSTKDEANGKRNPITKS